MIDVWVLLRGELLSVRMKRISVSNISDFYAHVPVRLSPHSTGGGEEELDKPHRFWSRDSHD
jgi:hypothetical protein